ncbi:MAG TPA: PAS domain-containing protein [Rhizomicrobium sp.]|nr:PAS domain-containing protein [Rhizomicrobium sp.]
MADLPPPNVEIDRDTDWPGNLSFIRDYWLDKRGARTMPSRDDIHPAQLKPWLPHLLLADVIEGGADFRYRLVGTELRRFFRAEPSTKYMSEALAPFGAETVQATLDSYRAVVGRRAPMRLTGAGSWYGQDLKLFDALLAPLSDDDARVNMILGTFVFEWDVKNQFRNPRDSRLAG